MHEHSSCLAALRPQCKYQSLTQSISVDASCPPVQNDATIPNQARLYLARALSAVMSFQLTAAPQPADRSYITGLGVWLIGYLSSPYTRPRSHIRPNPFLHSFSSFLYYPPGNRSVHLGISSQLSIARPPREVHLILVVRSALTRLSFSFVVTSLCE